MPHTIKVNEPIEYDSAVVAAVLGENALPVDVTDRVLAPFITVNGRIHTPTSNFLRHQCTVAPRGRRRRIVRPNLATARRLASDLAGWVEHVPGLLAAVELGDIIERNDPTEWEHGQASHLRFYAQACLDKFPPMVVGNIKRSTDLVPHILTVTGMYMEMRHG